MNEGLALQVIRELAAAEELYREILKTKASDLTIEHADHRLKLAGDRARSFLIEFDDS